MKKVLIIMSMLIVTTISSAKQFENHIFAAGLAVGNDLKGVNVLAYNENEFTGYSITLSLINSGDTDIALAIDKLWFTPPGESFPLYYGFGAKITDDSDNLISARGVLGASYFPEKMEGRLEVFGEITPTIELFSDSYRPKFRFAIGGRYYM